MRHLTWFVVDSAAIFFLYWLEVRMDGTSHFGDALGTTLEPRTGRVPCVLTDLSLNSALEAPVSLEALLIQLGPSDHLDWHIRCLSERLVLADAGPLLLHEIETHYIV